MKLLKIILTLNILNAPFIVYADLITTSEEALGELSLTLGKELGTEITGYGVKKNGDENEVQISYAVSNIEIKPYIYDCHAHDDHFHCEDIGDQKSYTYTHGLTRTYTTKDFVIGSKEAFALFEAKVQPMSSVTGFEVWQYRTNQIDSSIHVTISYLDSKTNTPAKSFMLCHYHGNAIDCHRKKEEGPNKPQWID